MVQFILNHAELGIQCAYAIGLGTLIVVLVGVMLPGRYRIRMRGPKWL